MTDQDQHRRTVRVLELLGESSQAFRRGDPGEADRLVGEAADVDAMAMSGIYGGVLTGEIPSPDLDWAGWCEYVQAARDALAAAESDDMARGGRGPSASYEEWLAEGREGGGDGGPS